MFADPRIAALMGTGRFGPPTAPMFGPLGQPQAGAGNIFPGGYGGYMQPANINWQQVMQGSVPPPVHAPPMPDKPGSIVGYTPPLWASLIGRGDAAARGAYHNDRKPSEGMLRAMENMGWGTGLLGVAARGLAKMERADQSRRGDRGLGFGGGGYGTAGHEGYGGGGRQGDLGRDPTPGTAGR